MLWLWKSLKTQGIFSGILWPPCSCAQWCAYTCEQLHNSKIWLGLHFVCVCLVLAFFVFFCDSFDRFVFCCYILLGLVFFSTEPRGWLGRTSPKWLILCRAGRETWTLSVGEMQSQKDWRFDLPQFFSAWIFVHLFMLLFFFTPAKNNTSVHGILHHCIVAAASDVIALLLLLLLLLFVSYRSDLPVSECLYSHVSSVLRVLHHLRHVLRQPQFVWSEILRSSSRELKVTTGAAAHNLDEEHSWWPVFAGSWDIWG